MVKIGRSAVGMYAHSSAGHDVEVVEYLPAGERLEEPLRSGRHGPWKESMYITAHPDGRRRSLTRQYIKSARRWMEKHGVVPSEHDGKRIDINGCTFLIHGLIPAGMRTDLMKPDATVTFDRLLCRPVAGRTQDYIYQKWYWINPVDVGTRYSLVDEREAA